MADVGNLTAKLTLDTAEFEKGTKSVGGFVDDMTKSILKADIIKDVFQGAVDGAVKLGQAFVDMGKQAVQSYADYEQLVGGGQLAFGEAFAWIEDRAVEAYKNVGLSQNEYLKQVNGFAVGLKTALGGNEQAAAELADKIVTAEADVVAAMGITKEAAQNAFNGIMKGNFTMVDNLQLGIKPTKEGYQEMIDSVNAWNEAQGRATQYSMDNIADMQAALVDYIEMQGLAGYASNEASSTIAGSLNMVKAAWEDVMLSVAGGGKGMEEAIASLVDSVKAFAGNLIPVVEEALWGLGDLVKGLAPVILDALPEFIANVLPGLIEAAISIVYALIEALPEIMEVLVGAIPDIVEQILEVTYALIEVLMEDGLPMLLELAVNILLTLADSLVENLPNLVPALVNMLLYMVETIVMNLDKIIMGGLQIIMALATALVDNEDKLFLAIAELVIGGLMTLTMHLPEFLEMGVKIVLKVAEGIIMAIPNFLHAVGEMLGIVDSADKQVRKTTSSMHDVVKSTTISMSDFTQQAAQNTAVSAQAVAQNAEKSKNLVEAALTGLERNFTRAMQISRKYFYELETQIHNTAEELLYIGSIEATPRMDPSNVVKACADIVRACEEAIAALERLASAKASAGARASGGWVQSGETYLVGELGPELITPTRSGYVHTAEETADLLGGSGTGGGDIYITIQGDVYDDERSMKNKLTDAMLSVLQEQVAYA